MTTPRPEILLAAAVLSFAASAPLHAQRPMLGDKPDLSGIWISGGYQLHGLAEPAPDPTASPPEPPPYQEWALPRVAELASNNLNDPSVHCLPLGVPRSALYPFPFEIVQTPNKVVILYEAMNVFRVIQLDAEHPPADELDPSFMGHSVGRWEGDTLVVDVIGFNDRTWLTGFGQFHTEQLHVVERYSLTEDNKLHYKVTMTDPGVLTRPWTITRTYQHFPWEERLREFVCLEDNQDVEHIDPNVNPRTGAERR